MTAGIEVHRSLKDYDLVGEQAALAVEKGLADAKWYTSPIPKEQMRAAARAPRWPGGARHPALVRAAARLLAGRRCCCGAPGGPSSRLLIYGVLYASSSDSRWHESSHGTAFKTDWMNNALYEIASFMVHARSRSAGAGATPATTATRSSWAAMRRSPCPRPISHRRVAPEVLQHPDVLQVLPERAAARPPAG